MWKIRFYRNSRGDCPVDDYLAGLDKKVRVKIYNILQLLRDKGPGLKRPYADHLKKGIRELRVIFSGNQYRVLHFFFMKDFIICTHGFTKKTDEVPVEEIKRAIRFKKDLEIRYARGEYEL